MKVFLQFVMFFVLSIMAVDSSDVNQDNLCDDDSHFYIETDSQGSSPPPPPPPPSLSDEESDEDIYSTPDDQTILETLLSRPIIEDAVNNRWLRKWVLIKNAQQRVQQNQNNSNADH